MNDIDKTKEQLLQELSALRDQIEKLRISERENREERTSLEEAEVLYRTAIEHSNDGVVVLAGNERLYCNKKYLEILGYGCHEEVSEKPLFQLVHPDDRETVAEYARRRQEGEGVPSSYECRLIKKDGSTVHVAISASTITYKGRLASLGFIRDITEQKKIQETLKLSEGNLRTILDSVNDAIFIHNIDGKIVNMNSKMLEMYRVSAEEARSMSIAEDFSTPDNPLDELPGIWDSVMGGKNKFFEWKARRPHDGSFFNVEVFLRKITLNDTDVILASVHDITERKLAEERLRESRRFLSDLIEHSGALVFVKDREGRYELVNRKWEEVTGLSRRDVIGKTDEELFPGPTGSQFRLNDLEVMESGLVLEKEEILEDERGKRFFISIKFPLRGEDAAVAGICGMVTEITARKEMEEELAISRDRLSRAEIISRTGNWKLDVGSEQVFASDGAYRIYGLPAGKWRIRDIQKISLPGYRQVLDTALKALIEEGRPYDVEFRIRRPDTDEIVDIHSVAEYDPEKKVVFGIIQDITDHKKAESQLKKALEALGKSESLLRAITDSAQDAILMMDTGGCISFWNPAAEHIFGYTREEAVGRNLHRFLAPGRFLEKYDAVFERFKTTGQGRVTGRTVELQALRNNGEEFPIELSLSAIRLEDGWHAVGIVRDITDRKRTEEDLRTSERKYRSVIENIQDVFYRSDASGLLRMGSPSGARMFGYDSVDEMIGLPLDDFWVDPALRMKLIDQVKRKGGVKDFEAVLKKKDGTTFNASFTTQFYYDDDGNFLGTEGIIRDITDRKLLESQLLQAHKMEAIGTLAGGIAHDFNNLLMGIQGNASLMLHDMDPAGPHYQKLKNIEEIVRDGSDLTGRLLGFAQGGKYEVRAADINGLIARTADMFGRTRKEIVIHRDLAGNLPNVEIDQGQIEQVFVNLYLNAWQAMPGGGDIYLKTESVVLEEAHTMRYSARPGKYVRVTVSDTGVGMDDTTQKRIFEPFFTTREMGRGSGLGLASAYGVIKNHGGIIEVSSERGHGTTFTIYLPVTEKGPAREKEAPVSPQKGFGTILVVDDQEMLLETSSEMLRMLGYNVLTADGGQKAIELYEGRKDTIDVVILDMIMPGLSGAATYDRLKEICSGVKVILSSGYSLDGEASRILERGCNGFIQKPFSMEALSKKVREILEGN